MPKYSGCTTSPVSFDKANVRPQIPRESFDFVVCLTIRLTSVGARVQCLIGALFCQYLSRNCLLQDTPSEAVYFLDQFRKMVHALQLNKGFDGLPHAMLPPPAIDEGGSMLYELAGGGDVLTGIAVKAGAKAQSQWRSDLLDMTYPRSRCIVALFALD